MLPYILVFSSANVAEKSLGDGINTFAFWNIFVKLAPSSSPSFGISSSKHDIEIITEMGETNMVTWLVICQGTKHNSTHSSPSLLAARDVLGKKLRTMCQGRKSPSGNYVVRNRKRQLCCWFARQFCLRNRKHGHPLLICSLLSTAQLYRFAWMPTWWL